MKEKSTVHTSEYIMIKKPCRPGMYWNSLGRMLKLWRYNRVSDAHAVKLLKMWLGYDLVDLMDDYGRYPSYNFNELRHRLHFSSFSTILDSMRSSRSFYIVGKDDGTITAIISPLWHEWEEADGKLLPYSLTPIGDSHDPCPPASHILSHNCDVKRNLNKYTTVSTDAAVSPDGAPDSTQVNPIDRIPRDVHVRRRAVRDYFRWVIDQKDSEHVALVEDIRYRIMNPRDKCGQIIDALKLTEEQTSEVWEILIERFLVPYFATRDEFFRPGYIAHPEKRIYWMTAFMKRYGGRNITDARKKWRYGRRSRESEQAHEENQLQQQYRPLSPHEWQTPDGQRWYLTQKGQKQQIPETAEPRPTDTSTFNYIKNQWQETKN